MVPFAIAPSPARNAALVAIADLKNEILRLEEKYPNLRIAEAFDHQLRSAAAWAAALWESEKLRLDLEAGLLRPGEEEFRRSRLKLISSVAAWLEAGLWGEEEPPAVQAVTLAARAAVRALAAVKAGLIARRNRALLLGRDANVAEAELDGTARLETAVGRLVAAAAALRGIDPRERLQGEGGL